MHSHFGLFVDINEPTKSSELIVYFMNIFFNSDSTEIEEIVAPEDKGPVELTMEEYRAQQADSNKDKKGFNIRKAGEGVDDKQWKGVHVLKKDEETESEEEDEEDVRIFCYSICNYSFVNYDAFSDLSGATIYVSVFFSLSNFTLRCHCFLAVQNVQDVHLANTLSISPFFVSMYKKHAQTIWHFYYWHDSLSAVIHRSSRLFCPRPGKIDNRHTIPHSLPSNIEVV